jgi:predicted metal-dependent hydrolase
MKPHPYAEATYQIIRLDAGGFGVRVSVPAANPTTVSRFDTEAAADAWIASHKSRVETQSQPRTVFRRHTPSSAR